MLEVIQGDITTLRVDAIVNAANAALRGGGGVDGAIHRAAGPALLEACRLYSGCPTGSAVITPGFRLPARWVIHTVGPVWRGGGQDEARLLRDAYVSAIKVAAAHPDIRSIAFPAISTGIYSFPKPEAARIAVAAIKAAEHLFDRLVACLSDAEHAAIYRAAIEEVGNPPA